MAILNDHGVPVGPVNTAEDIFRDPHVAARESIMEIPDPEVGTQRFARSSPVLSDHPDLPARPSPRLGEHTREILEQMLGYGPAEVAGLVAAGIVEVADEGLR